MQPDALSGTSLGKKFCEILERRYSLIFSFIHSLAVDKGKQPAYSNVASYKLPMVSIVYTSLSFSLCLAEVNEVGWSIFFILKRSIYHFIV